MFPFVSHSFYHINSFLQVCTKVASYLEQGQRLENLSWRLWHLQNLMVDTDNAKSKREFKKLSKCMGDKLDKEKGRCVVSALFSRNPRP
jgi:GATA-binding protein